MSRMFLNLVLKDVLVFVMFLEVGVIAFVLQFKKGTHAVPIFIPEAQFNAWSWAGCSARANKDIGSCL